MQRDAAVTRVTPKTPAERSREYRKRQRDAATAALVTPATVTPELVVPPIVPATDLGKGEREDLAKLARQWRRLSKQRVDASRPR